MADSMLYQEDMFVLLEPGQPEQFITPDELFAKLKQILSTRQDNLPVDLQKLSGLDAQAQNLIDTTCELELEAGKSLQWYVVRLEK